MTCSLSAEWEFPSNWFARICLVKRAVYENRVDVLMWWASNEKINKKTSKYYLKCVWAAYCLDKMVEKITELEAMEWLWEYSEIGDIEPVCSCRKDTGIVVPVCACYVDSIVYQTVSSGNIPLLSWLITKNIMAKHGINSYIIIVAIKYKHVSVLEWMEKNAEVSNSVKTDENNVMLNYALNKRHLPSLRWLEKYGAASAEKCRETGMLDMLRTCNELLHEWFAERLTLAELTRAGLTKVWWQVWRQKVLVMVLAGRRRRMRRPPPEILQLIVAEFTN